MDFIVVIQREDEHDRSWKRKVSLMEAAWRRLPPLSSSSEDADITRHASRS